MKTLFAVPLLLLTACGFTSEGNLVRSAVAERGAQAYDEGLGNAEWYICNAASIGSVRRRYGTSEDRAALYRSLCKQDLPGNVIGP